MNDRVAAIIVDNDRVLLVHRRKPDQDYYVLPGGSLEPTEAIEEACIREVKEETGLMITLGKVVFLFNNNGRSEHYYLASSFRGDLRVGEPESQRQTSENQYMLEWVGKGNLRQVNLQPREIRQVCVDCVSTLS